MKKPTSGKTKVFLSDDHLATLVGLKQIISEADDLLVVGEATNGIEVIKKLQSTEANVLVLDLCLPGKSGWEVLAQLKSEGTKLPVLIMSLSPESDFAIPALKSGASGYLSKTCDPSLIVEAVRKLAKGGKYISPAVAEKLAIGMESNFEKEAHETLTTREFQIMLMLSSGKMLSDIAKELALCPATVSSHRASILNKMGIENNAQLMRYAINKKLV